MALLIADLSLTSSQISPSPLVVNFLPGSPPWLIIRTKICHQLTHRALITGSSPLPYMGAQTVIDTIVAAPKGVLLCILMTCAWLHLVDWTEVHLVIGMILRGYTFDIPPSLKRSNNSCCNFHLKGDPLRYVSSLFLLINHPTRHSLTLNHLQPAPPSTFSLALMI